MTKAKDSEGPGGRVSVMDFVVRKQKRVCGSTFSAEINALSDSLEHGKTLQLALHKIERGISPASELLVLQTNGQ